MVNVDSTEQLDQLLYELPIMKKMGDQVTVDVTALTHYDKYATAIHKAVRGADAPEVILKSSVEKREGLFYFIESTVRFEGNATPRTQT